MSKEKIILSLVAITVGIAVATAAFYFYQSTKVIPPEKEKSIVSETLSPSPTPSVSLIVNEPKDEEVVNTKILKISGKTDPKATVVILANSDQQVVEPSQDGEFSTTITLDQGVNTIKITSTTKNGLSNTIQRTVTYSTEEF